MKQVAATLGWALAFWFTASISVASLPSSTSGSAASGTIHLSGTLIVLPMVCGVFGMGLGLLGLLPGTGPDDGGKSEE